MLARFNGNVVPFANDATSTNRTVFGGTTQSDSIDDNLNADFKKGWEIVGLNDNPTREDFNAMGYTLGALTAYLYQMGIAEYNELQEYKLNGLCLGTDGTIYQSLVDANIGNALTNGTKWKNVTSSFVDLVNNQSIDGIKTFVKSPIVPTPTTGTQAVNKDYADLKVALASFVGTNQNLSVNGYQNLPGGLIIQWGRGTNQAGSDNANNAQTITYPVAFPNTVFSVFVTGYIESSLNVDVVWMVYGASNNTNFRTFANLVNASNGNTLPFWLAIGY